MLYKVKLDIFEGPFELLVYLIENAEMSIYDIQVSEITRQYIEYVEQINKVDAVLAGEFMVLAASLIEIKSKMLLPRKCDESGPDTAEDPRSELVQRLLEYKKYKFAAACLEEQEERQQRIYTKPQEDLAIYTRETDYYLSLDLIPFIRAFELFLQKKKKIEEVQKRYNIIKLQQMSIESRIEQIRHLFRRKRVFKFRELLGGEKTRKNVVLTFLSMLELIRQKTVKASQNVNFGEITFTINEKMPDNEKEG
ncbi:MAG TPA: segregation/condensation protein A [Bacillota bacterium]|jgi:segregation and condensation protein A|nr:segregation/condensation protein A [Bacillota bacterium]